MYSAQDLENKTQAQLAAILNDELGFSVTAAQAKKLKNTGLRNMVLEAQEVELAQEPEVQAHPEVESQEQPEDALLNSEQVMVLEARLEIACSDEALPEASQDDEQGEASDEVMSPQEQLTDSSAQIRESIAQDNELGRILAEGLKEVADKHDKKATASKKSATSTTRGNLYISPKGVAQIKPIKAGSKHHVLVTHLLQGATIAELAQATNWKPASVRSAFSYDINSIKGYGVRQEGDKFYLVMPVGMGEPVVQ